MKNLKHQSNTKLKSKSLSARNHLLQLHRRRHFLSFSFILIVYRVLEAFSLNATLIFTLIIIIIIMSGRDARYTRIIKNTAVFKATVLYTVGLLNTAV